MRISKIHVNDRNRSSLILWQEDEEHGVPTLRLTPRHPKTSPQLLTPYLLSPDLSVTSRLEGEATE